MRRDYLFCSYGDGQWVAVFTFRGSFGPFGSSEKSKRAAGQSVRVSSSGYSEQEIKGYHRSHQLPICSPRERLSSFRTSKRLWLRTTSQAGPRQVPTNLCRRKGQLLLFTVLRSTGSGHQRSSPTFSKEVTRLLSQRQSELKQVLNQFPQYPRQPTHKGALFCPQKAIATRQTRYSSHQAV